MTQTMITLSAPASSGFRAEFETVEEARAKAADLLGCAVDDMVEILSGDGGTTYCYATQEQADADAGTECGYAVQYSSEQN